MTAALHTTTTDAPARAFQITAYRTRFTAIRRMEDPEDSLSFWALQATRVTAHARITAARVWTAIGPCIARQTLRRPSHLRAKTRARSVQTEHPMQQILAHINPRHAAVRHAAIDGGATTRHLQHNHAVGQVPCFRGCASAPKFIRC